MWKLRSLKPSWIFALRFGVYRTIKDHRTQTFTWCAGKELHICHSWWLFYVAAYLLSLFTLGVCFILLFEFGFLWLQNGTLTVSQKEYSLFFWMKTERSGLELFFGQMKIFRLFISKERSFPQKIPFLEKLLCQGAWRWLDVLAAAMLQGAGSATASLWECCGINGIHSAFPLLLQV